MQIIMLVHTPNEQKLVFLSFYLTALVKFLKCSSSSDLNETFFLSFLLFDFQTKSFTWPKVFPFRIEIKLFASIVSRANRHRNAFEIEKDHLDSSF